MVRDVGNIPIFPFDYSDSTLKTGSYSEANGSWASLIGCILPKHRQNPGLNPPGGVLPLLFPDISNRNNLHSYTSRMKHGQFYISGNFFGKGFVVQF